MNTQTAGVEKSCCTSNCSNESVNKSSQSTKNSRVYKPAIDILENENEILILADVPGSSPEQIDVHLEKGVLYIRGCVSDRAPTDGRFLLQEYGVGEFNRSFEIGEAIDAEQIRAEYVDGVLTLHLPKKKAAQAKKITVGGPSH